MFLQQSMIIPLDRFFWIKPHFPPPQCFNNLHLKLCFFYSFACTSCLFICYNSSLAGERQCSLVASALSFLAVAVVSSLLEAQLACTFWGNSSRYTDHCSLAPLVHFGAICSLVCFLFFFLCFVVCIEQIPFSILNILKVNFCNSFLIVIYLISN
jgi:hypothetical protein